MKEILISLLLVGILRGIETLAVYNLETGNPKVVSIIEYRNRAAMRQLCRE